MKALYCLDTSSVVAAWDERYPPDNFPRFWTLLDGALTQGLILVPEAVVDELEKKSRDAAAWVKQRTGAVVAYENEIQVRARAILADHPKLVMARKIAFAADPFVIATALIKGVAVVTEEGHGSLARPHIPDVCGAVNVQCINLLGVIRAQAWVIG
jgi:hypothetical protein